MTYAYRLIPGGYIDSTGPHRGIPPSQDDLDRIERMTLHRRLLNGPYDEVITQVLPIEEIKRRYPNTPIPRQAK